MRVWVKTNINQNVYTIWWKYLDFGDYELKKYKNAWNSRVSKKLDTLAGFLNCKPFLLYMSKDRLGYLKLTDKLLRKATELILHQNL